MKLLYPFSIFFLIAFLFACNKRHRTHTPGKTVVVDVQPFTGTSAAQVSYVAAELRKVFPAVKVLPVLSYPAAAFYVPRQRYRADTLIAWLSDRTQEDHVTIGITNKDISAARGDIADFGIMGLGYCPGAACIASSFRLSKTETNEQLFKVAIHELGHTEGLPHCEVKTCFMRDAEGHNPTGEEKEFCPKCKAFLQRRGWGFNS
jgi:archaemetzincin